MDIHRCRFVPFPASAINAVAFSHSYLPTSKKSSNTTPARLAIGRANGDIEIWNPPRGSWHQEVVIRGGKERSIDGLVWMTGTDEELDTGKTIHGRSRLFSIGYTSTVTEWDLERGRARNQASGQHGDIWCLGLQPRPASGPGAQKLVGGTADGALVLYSTEDDDLRFQRISRTAARHVKMVSIAFQSRQLAVVGCSDGTIRVFNLSSGAMVKAMSLGRDLASQARDIIVWSVRCLPSGDIVSGDSTGQLCIWDGKTFTQAQRIQGHSQDVLSLATSADGTSIFSGGMDKRTVLYREMPGKASRWAKVWHRRYHSHDVKTMASFEAKGISVVVSGVVMPLRRSGVEHHRMLPHLPQSIPLCSAPRARLMVSWWDREVRIWRLEKRLDEMLEAGQSDAEVEKNRKLLGRVLVKGDSNIAAAAISEDGELLVVSTVSEVKAFQLTPPRHGHAGEALKVSKMALPAETAAQGASSLAISPDGQWVCLAQGKARLAISKVDRAENSTVGAKLSIGAKALVLHRLKREVPRHQLLGGLGSYDRQVTHIAFSPDSRLLAVADLAGYVDTWLLQAPGPGGDVHHADADASSSSSSSDLGESEKESGPADAGPAGPAAWIRNPRARLFPKLPSAPVVLSFSDETPAPGSTCKDYVLLAVTASSELVAFQPLLGRVAPWNRRVKLSTLPVEYRNIRDLAKGVLWRGSRLWIYGASFVCMIDTSVEPHGGATDTVAAAAAPPQDLEAKQGVKRKRGADTGAGNKMTTKAALAPQHVKMDSGDGSGQLIDLDMDDEEGLRADSGDDDNDDDDKSGSERQLTRGGREAVVKSGGQAQTRGWWCTFKFRPILGVVALGDAGSREDLPLEVAIVERPTWDLDLPARYAGDDDWE